MSDETTPEPQRAAFEAWLMAEHLLDATWNAERNCYDEFPAHLAWKAWQRLLAGRFGRQLFPKSQPLHEQGEDDGS